MSGTRTLAAAAALALAATLTAAAPATANTRPCVTKREAYNVHRHDTMRHIHRVFDTDGHLVSRSGHYQMRDYRTCDRSGSFVSVEYRHRQASYIYRAFV